MQTQPSRPWSSLRSLQLTHCAGAWADQACMHQAERDMDWVASELATLRYPLHILQAERDLDWRPQFSLIDGLRDSYEKDFGRGTFRKAADFTTDDMILQKAKVPVMA